jgi:hypothetical protein
VEVNIKKMAWGKKKEFKEPIEDDGDLEQEETSEPEERVERRGRPRLPENEPAEKPSRQLSKEEVDDMVNGTLQRLIQLIEIRRRM